jgi:hypothetical protein
MQLIALKYFATVAENGSFVAAAIVLLTDLYFDQKRLSQGAMFSLTIFERSRGWL